MSLLISNMLCCNGNKIRVNLTYNLPNKLGIFIRSLWRKAQAARNHIIITIDRQGRSEESNKSMNITLMYLHFSFEFIESMNTATGRYFSDRQSLFKITIMSFDNFLNRTLHYVSHFCAVNLYSTPACLMADNSAAFYNYE